jgi:hypothetical protein
MCFFLLHKIKKNHSHFTTIIGNNGTRFATLLEDRRVNPVRDWNEQTEQLVRTYIGNIKNNGIYNRGKLLATYNIGNSTIENNTTYSLIYKPKEKLSVKEQSLATGFGEKKIVLFLISPNLELECDMEGVYGVGPNTFYFPFQNKEDGYILEKFFKSDLYKNLMLSTKTTRQFIKIACLQYLNIEKILKKSYKNLIKKYS